MKNVEYKYYIDEIVNTNNKQSSITLSARGNKKCITITGYKQVIANQASIIIESLNNDIDNEKAKELLRLRGK